MLRDRTCASKQAGQTEVRHERVPETGHEHVVRSHASMGTPGDAVRPAGSASPPCHAIAAPRPMRRSRPIRSPTGTGSGTSRSAARRCSDWSGSPSMYSLTTASSRRVTTTSSTARTLGSRRRVTATLRGGAGRARPRPELPCGSPHRDDPSEIRSFAHLTGPYSDVSPPRAIPSARSSYGPTRSRARGSIGPPARSTLVSH